MERLIPMAPYGTNMEGETFTQRMERLTTCDGCGGTAHDGAGFCLDCRTPDYEYER